MKTALYLAAIIALLAVGGSAVWIAHSAAQLRADLNATQESLTASVESARADLAITQAAMVNVLDKRTGELTAQAHKLSGAVSRSLSKADGAMGAVATIPAAVSPVLKEAASTATELGKTADAIAEVIVDLHQMADDLYPDIKAGVESGTVAARNVAEASGSVDAMARSVEKETPEIATSVRSTSKDLSTIVKRFARPVSAIKGAAGIALNFVGKFFGF